LTYQKRKTDRYAYIGIKYQTNVQQGNKVWAGFVGVRVEIRRRKVGQWFGQYEGISQHTSNY
jgi:hypothetical protein